LFVARIIIYDYINDYFESFEVFSFSSEILFLFSDLFSFIVDDVYDDWMSFFLEIVSVFCSGEESSNLTFKLDSIFNIFETDAWDLVLELYRKKVELALVLYAQNSVLMTAHGKRFLLRHFFGQVLNRKNPSYKK
jgi:hypothetical protein